METSGHSIGSPRLMAEAGIEAVFILNIEPEDRLLRLEDRAMEFIWRPMYSHLARRAELLGHVFYDFYTSPLDILLDDFTPSFDPSSGHLRPGPPKKPVPPPHAFNLQANSTPEIDQDDENFSKLRDYLKEMSQYYRTKHLLMMVGAN